MEIKTKKKATTSLQLLPKVSFTTNWCWCLQFGVKIIIDAIKLTHSNPVATPHRKRQETQAHIGRDINDEANQPCQGQLLEGSIHKEKKELGRATRIIWEEDEKTILKWPGEQDGLSSW